MKHIDKQELINSLHKAISIDSSPTKVLCSSERVAEIKDALTTSTSNYPWREAFEEIWGELFGIQKEYYQGINTVDREYDSQRNPVDTLNFALEMPRFPAPELLLAINEAFTVYMAAGGELELEDVFFGPSKKGVGNYAARKKKEKQYGNFDFFVRYGCLTFSKEELEQHRKTSLENKAIEYLAHGQMAPTIAQKLNKTPNYQEIPDPESYLRGYRRWKRTNK